MEIDPHADPLQRLGQEILEAGQLPASRFSSKRAQRFFQPALDSGTLEKIASPSGRGWIFHVAKPERFGEFMRTRFPEDNSASNEDEIDTPRARSILRTGDSKTRGRKLDFFTLLLRGFDDCKVERNGESLNIAEMTSSAGCASILFKDGDTVAYNGAIALVENAELWAYFERLGLSGIPLVCYYGGVISWRILDWLQSPEMGGARIIHFADYDPVGLREYRRLKVGLGARVSLYLPDNLADYFQRRFTADRILEKRPNRSTLADLLDEADPDIRKVIDLIMKFGTVLEQEALLIDLTGR